MISLEDHKITFIYLHLLNLGEAKESRLRKYDILLNEDFHIVILIGRIKIIAKIIEHNLI